MISTSYGLFLLAFSLLLPLVFLKMVRSFLKIPTIEAQRNEAKLIFGRRVIRPEKEVFEELADYFLVINKLHRRFISNIIMLTVMILIIKVGVWRVVSLPPLNVILSGLLFIFLLIYGTMMTVIMINSTRELVEEEYGFLMNQIYGK